MVCRIMITNKGKNVVVDIDESINSLGLSNISTETDANGSAKRRRTPSNSIGSERPSPYLTRTPTGTRLSKVSRVQEIEATHKFRVPDTCTPPSTLSTTLGSHGFFYPSPSSSPEQGKVESSPTWQSKDEMQIKAICSDLDVKPFIFLPAEVSSPDLPEIQPSTAQTAFRKTPAPLETTNLANLPAEAITSRSTTVDKDSSTPSNNQAPASISAPTNITRHTRATTEFSASRGAIKTNPQHLHLAQNPEFWRRERSNHAMLRDLKISTVDGGMTTVQTWRELFAKYQDERSFRKHLSSTERAMVVARLDTCVYLLERTLQEVQAEKGREGSD